MKPEYCYNVVLEDPRLKLNTVSILTGRIIGTDTDLKLTLPGYLCCLSPEAFSYTLPDGIKGSEYRIQVLEFGPKVPYVYDPLYLCHDGCSPEAIAEKSRHLFFVDIKETKEQVMIITIGTASPNDIFILNGAIVEVPVPKNKPLHKDSNLPIEVSDRIRRLEIPNNVKEIVISIPDFDPKSRFLADVTASINISSSH